jgi:hypothetical protein
LYNMKFSSPSFFFFWVQVALIDLHVVCAVFHASKFKAPFSNPVYSLCFFLMIGSSCQHLSFSDRKIMIQGQNGQYPSMQNQSGMLSDLVRLTLPSLSPENLNDRSKNLVQH